MRILDLTQPSKPIEIRDNPIGADEIRTWVGPTAQGRLQADQYVDIANTLNRFRWPTDPPAVQKLVAQLPEDDRFWNFAAADHAAETLLAHLPRMIEFWKGLQWAPETRAGYQLMRNLEHSLEAAAPLIKHPFGPPGPKTRQPRGKDWHSSAVMIANIVLRALLDAGQLNPSITRNSVTARVVHNALKRMGFQGAEMVGTSAVAMHLQRWNDQFGLVIRGA